jgi:cell division protein FtsI (penicillin-binding protein 3)
MRSFVNMSETRRFAVRCVAIGVVMAVLFGVCFGQLVNIQLLNGKVTAEAATAARTLKVPVGARRGRILDANGAVLAQSVERYTIVADPQIAQEFVPTDCVRQTQGRCHEVGGKPVGVKGAAAVARIIAPVLGMNAMELGAKLSVPGRYVVIKKDVEPSVKRKLDKLNLGGIIYGELSEQRVYSGGNVLGALLGGVNDKGHGVSGIEAKLDKELSGADGYKVYQQGNGGVEIPGTLTDSKDARNGSDIRLTIDSDVDWYVKKTLVEGCQKFKADWAIAVVQDARTHEILALEDNDDISAGSDAAKLNVSRAVRQTFEPGSVGKVFTVAGMVQSGAHQMTDKFQVPDRFEKKGQSFHDAVSHPVSNWTLAGVLQNSSNVGTVMAAENYNDQQRYDYLTKFGIGQSTGLDLPGESNGTLASPKAWDGRTRDTILFGQGYAVNLMQLNNAIGVVADGGVYKKPLIVKSTIDPEGHSSVKQSEEGVRVLDQGVNAQISDAMESAQGHYEAVTGIAGYRSAGKSGTAEVNDGDGKLDSVISDWSGFLPADNPRFVITVAMSNPEGSLGGITAGPLFNQIGEFLMQKYEVPTSAPRMNAIPVDW